MYSLWLVGRFDAAFEAFHPWVSEIILIRSNKSEEVKEWYILVAKSRLFAAVL